MRLGTWNVAYGTGQRPNERRRRQMVDLNADIWVLTETSDGLSPGPDYQPVRSAQRPRDASGVVDGSRWVTIWSRNELNSTPVEVTDEERTAAALLEWDGNRILLFGTVLPWLTDTARQGIATELERQAQDWTTLPAIHDAICCVAGDFNVNLGGPRYYGSNANKQAVEDQLAEAGLVAATSFERTRHLLPDHGVIDHIALPLALAGSTRVVSVFGPRSAADDEPMSDHTGVVVQFTWPA